MVDVENTEHHEEHHFNDAGASHVLPWHIYLIVWFILLFLMAATVAAAHFDMGIFNNIVALTIAVIKATLVVLFFMQVKFSSRLTWLWAGIGFIWLIFLFATMGDYFTREWVHVTGWQ